VCCGESVAADVVGSVWPYVEETTTDFTYVRLHGAAELYTSSYDKAALEQWAAKIRVWSRVSDVYVYFDNTARAAAPRNAERLAALLGRVPA
jgi:uncharacterized protein YecE (DUF72 family)